MIITPAFAQASGGFGSGIGGFLPIILIFGIMYFLMIRKVKEEDEVEVEISKDVKVRVVKSTVVNVLNKTEPTEKA